MMKRICSKGDILKEGSAEKFDFPMKVLIYIILRNRNKHFTSINYNIMPSHYLIYTEWPKN